MFTKEPTLKEKSRAWMSNLKKEQRNLDRDMQKMEKEESKLKVEIKKAAAKNQKAACLTLAKAIVKSQKTRSQLLDTKTNINSVILHIKTTVASVTVAQAYQKSSTILAGMQRLISIPRITQVASAMNREMVKAGVIEEVISDSLEMAESEDIEEEADQQVDSVLYELTAGQLGSIPALNKKVQQKQVDVDQHEKKENEMKTRLENL